MREIKFRVWNPENKKMSMVGAIDWDMYYKVITCNTKDEKMYKLGHKDLDFILMQYTGLKDKNGTEIYEGDLLFSSDWCCNCEVIWEDGGFTLKEGETIYNLKENLTDDDGNYLDDVKVIGNIYENKELIK